MKLSRIVLVAALAASLVITSAFACGPGGCKPQPRPVEQQTGY